MSEDYTIRCTDMEEDLMSSIVDLTQQVFAKVKQHTGSEMLLAEILKRTIDKNYPEGWNVVVGRSFGACVLQKARQFAYYRVAD
jgi:hypothetical protein